MLALPGHKRRPLSHPVLSRGRLRLPQARSFVTMVKKNSIPERWRSLKAVGQRVPGCRFIAFKVPLKGVTNQRVTQNQKFTPKDLISEIRNQNEELGLIIDLTNTERYYTTKDLPKSVQYVKLHTAGLKIPDDATIHQFKRVVWKFLAANSDNDKLIGVHCTTGINRTGYLICRYLIDVDEWRPLHALSAFSQARGHPIEGTVYIEDIVKGPPRSNVGIDLPPTIDEPRASENEYYNSPDDMPRDRRQREDSIKSLLEIIPGNEYADFDARDRRPLPLMRARSDEYQDDREFLRGRRQPYGDMSDDIDLRRNFPPNIPEHLDASERFRRPVDPEGRYNPGLEDRRDFHSSEPRPLMDVRDNYGPRDMQRPRGMPQDQMGYDNRTRGQQSPLQDYYEFEERSSARVQSFPPGKMSSAEFDDIEAERRMRSLNRGFDFRERAQRQEFQNAESENDRFDPRERETMTNSFKGPFNERMHPRNARALEGPMNARMNARNTQLPGETMNEMVHPRDRRELAGPIHERMPSRDARYMEGSVNERFPQRGAQGPINERFPQRDAPGPVNERFPQRDAPGPVNERFPQRDAPGPVNERFPQRDAPGPVNERFPQRDGQGIRNVMEERMRLQDLRSMGGPMNERIQSRDAQFMEGPVNSRMYSRDTRQMEAPINERVQPRVGRFMDPSVNERMNPREEQAMDNSVDDRMPQRDLRALNRIINERMTPRDVRSMEGPPNARMHPRIERAMEGTVSDQIHSREGPMNERMPLRDTRPMQGIMNERMYQRDVRTMPGSMNDQMHTRDSRAVEGTMSERMYARGAEFPGNKQRDFMNETRPFEGRKMNPSEDLLRGANRFAPYPSLMKQGQPPEIARGLPRQESRDPRDMLPASQDANAFYPPRNRFN